MEIRKQTKKKEVDDDDDGQTLINKHNLFGIFTCGIKKKQTKPREKKWPGSDSFQFIFFYY